MKQEEKSLVKNTRDSERGVRYTPNNEVLTMEKINCVLHKKFQTLILLILQKISNANFVEGCSVICSSSNSLVIMKIASGAGVCSDC